MEEWQPTFTYHGFRFVELTGFREKPSLSDFKGQVIYDEMETTGNLETSDPMINRIYKNAYWGIRGNYRGMPTDCPQRDERMGWLGDRAVGSQGESYIFNNLLLYAKWLDDIEQAQFTTPMLTTVHLPKEDMGKFALWLLLDRINNGHKAVTRMNWNVN